MESDVDRARQALGRVEIGQQLLRRDSVLVMVTAIDRVKDTIAAIPADHGWTDHPDWRAMRPCSEYEIAVGAT